MNYDRRKGMFCSGLLFGFWLLVSVAIIPDVIDYSIEYNHEVNYLYLSEMLMIYSIRLIGNIDACFKRNAACLVSFSFCIWLIYR